MWHSGDICQPALIQIKGLDSRVVSLLIEFWVNLKVLMKVKKFIVFRHHLF